MVHWTRVCSPDAARVFQDGSIAREPAGMRHVENGLSHPCGGLLVKRSGLFLDCRVRPKIGEVQVVVAVSEECVDDRTEYTRLVSVESAGAN